MEKPKIIVCTTAYRPMIGGAEVAIEEVAKRLAGEFDFFIVTARMSRAYPRRETGADGNIMRLGFGTPADKWFLPFLAPWQIRKLARGGPALLWGMDISQGSFAAAVSGWLIPRLPLVLTVQYGESENYLNTGRGGMIRMAFHTMLLRADAVTVISPYLERVARAHGYRGPCETIPNGADMKKFSAGERAAPAARHGRVVMTASRLVPKNGVDILIRAVAVIKKDIPDIRCRIAGDGPDRINLESLAASLDIRDSVEFLGAMPHAELAAVMRGADVFVRLSRSEGMGNAFVEAMAAGLPVVGTRVGGIPGIIDDGRTGLLAAPDDSADAAQKILRILRDPPYARDMAARARESVAERFEWGVIARRYRDVFDRTMSAEKRVTIATGLFPPDIGGPATYSAYMARALPRHGIGVRVSYFGDVISLPRVMRHAAYLLRLVWTARGSDILFAQDPFSVGLPAWIASRMTGARFVLKIVGNYAWEQDRAGRRADTARGGVSFETPEEFQKRRHGFLTEMRRYIQYRVARRADRIIVPSRYLGRLVAGWGVDRSKITVIYNAVAVPEQAGGREETRKRFGLAGIVIVAAGRFVPWKGFVELIDAVADLASAIPDIRLVIAGSGPEEAAMRARIEARGVGNCVSLTESVSHDVLAAYFAAGDIFALYSGYEGLSHTLIEGMAAGLPVVATNVGGNTEVVEDGVEGVIVPYGDGERLKDALHRLADDADVRAAMGARARARAAQFTPDRMLDMTARELKQCA
jgi:glycosyltransferase involved in cell wall biosynthesis